MSDVISFSLFGEGGFINPTPWSYGEAQVPARFEVPFYDYASDSFLRKQSIDFDGGWRWYDDYESDGLVIYNRKLDKRAYFILSNLTIQGTRLQPEVLLLWAKGMVVTDHCYYASKNWLEDHIRALAQRAWLDIIKEITGELPKLVRPVR